MWLFFAATSSLGSGSGSRSRLYGSSSKTSSFLASLNPARWGRTDRHLHKVCICFGVVKKITLLYTLLKNLYNLSSAIQNCAFPYERMYYKFDLTSMYDWWFYFSQFMMFKKKLIMKRATSVLWVSHLVIKGYRAGIESLCYLPTGWSEMYGAKINKSLHVSSSVIIFKINLSYSS